MSDEQNLDPDAGGSGPSEEERASALGWAPKEKWRGAEADWVDAKTFLDRGEKILPILKANNRKLEGDVVELRNSNQALLGQITEMRESMGEFLKTQAEMFKERLERERKELREKLREARQGDDDEAVDELEEALEANREKAKELERPPAKKTPSREESDTPEFRAWRSANAWFGGEEDADVAKTGAAIAYGRKLVAQGVTDQKTFFSKLSEYMERAFPSDRPQQKAEGNRPGGGTARAASGFDALPEDAKAQARSDAKRFVGANKLFKTEKEWFDHFTKLYNGEPA